MNPLNSQQYCTLFDSAYLSRALALYESLVKHAPHFHLYALTMDEMSETVLKEKQLPHLTIIPLKDFETAELREVKAQRNRGEYCWTCTPFLIQYCLEHFSLPICTYLDADICFFANPTKLLNEMPEHKSVLITEHRYPKAHDYSETLGRFCVQFVTFKNTPVGREILSIWANQCHEWCYDRIEPTRFGDQKYQNVWPEKWPNDVHILQHLGGGVAPWNANQYSILQANNQLMVKDETGHQCELVFYHFHAMKFISNETCWLSGEYALPKGAKQFIYPFYISQVARIAKDLAVSLPLGPLATPPTLLKRYSRLLTGHRPLAITVLKVLS